MSVFLLKQYITLFDVKLLATFAKLLGLQNDLEVLYRNSVSQNPRNMFVFNVLQLKTRV